MIGQLEEAERLQLVQQALTALSEEDRNILWMSLAEGRRPGEIADILGFTAEVVRTRKLRAARKITEFVQKKLSRTQADQPHS